MKLNQKTPIVLFVLTLMLTAMVAVSVFSEQVRAQTAGSITINNGVEYTNSTTLTLTLSASDAVQMRFSGDNSSWSDWESYATSKNWTVTEGDGDYTIYVQFKDNTDNISTASASIVVDTTPPQADAYADWYTDDYRTVYFDASYSADNFGIANYTWDFGDGNTTSGATAIHAYAEAGNYTVILTVEDLAGNTANASFPATIPDLTATPTPTPTPTSTVPPTVNPTVTTQPTATPTPSASGIGDWMFALIAIAVILVVGVVILLLLRNRSKPVP